MTDTGTERQVSLATKLIGYTIMLLIVLAVLEIAAYLYLKAFEGYDGEHLMTYEFDDYKNINPTPNYSNSKGIYHNAQGFRRDRDTSREKSPDTYRIFVMGGSTAYGLHSLSAAGKEKYSVIRNDETIDHYLEQFLADRINDKKIEVINAAITSHYSHHHLIYLNQKILKFNPDMIVFIDGFNDYFPYDRGYDQFLSYAYQERAHLFMGEPSFRALSGYVGWWLFRKSHFVHLAGKTLRPVILGVLHADRERAHIHVEEALQNLEVNAKNNYLKMVERNTLVLKHEGVTPVFVLQPEIVFEQSKEFTEMEKLIFEELDNHWQVNFVEYKNRALPMVTGFLKEATDRVGATYFDMTDIYGGLNEDAYTDYCHLTPHGNRRLAEVLGERIVPMILSDIRRDAGSMAGL